MSAALTNLHFRLEDVGNSRTTRRHPASIPRTLDTPIVNTQASMSSVVSTTPPKPGTQPEPSANDSPQLSKKAFRFLQQAIEDPSTWIAGPYAILLQLANPRLARGVSLHSNFAKQGHAISRFLRTAAFVVAVTHGTPAQRDAVVNVVKKQHSRVRGSWKGNETGSLGASASAKEGDHIRIHEYDARDAELQKWTAATLFVSMRKGRTTFNFDRGKVIRMRDRQEMELLMKGFGIFAQVLDMPWEKWFRDLDEFERYFEREMKRLVTCRNGGVDEESEKMGRLVMFELGLPWWLGWVVMPVVRLAMASWLPGVLRDAYGLEDPGRSWILMGCYAWFVWVVRVVNWGMPGVVRRLLTGGMVAFMARAVRDVEKNGRWMI